MNRLLMMLGESHGQCRLTRQDATTLKLLQANGSNLNIAGLPHQIPAAGVTVTNAGLSAETVYFVYAYSNAGAIALELSATGHSTSTSGIETKTGDTTRTLVGMVRTNASSQFVDDDTNICVLSWFNRRRKIGRARFTANRASVADPTDFSEVHTEIRVNFLTWADDAVRQAITGAWTVTGGGTGHGYCSIDGDKTGLRQWASHSASTTGTFASVDERLVAEGYHYGTLIGKNNGGTNALFIGGQNGEITQSVIVMG